MMRLCETAQRILRPRTRARPLAARMRSQGPIAVVLAVCQLVGFIGLWAVPADALNQAGGGWGVPIALMGSLVVPRIACGLPAGRRRYIEDEP